MNKKFYAFWVFYIPMICWNYKCRQYRHSSFQVILHTGVKKYPYTSIVVVSLSDGRPAMIIAFVVFMRILTSSFTLLYRTWKNIVTGLLDPFKMKAKKWKRENCRFSFLNIESFAIVLCSNCRVVQLNFLVCLRIDDQRADNNILSFKIFLNGFGRTINKI